MSDKLNILEDTMRVSYAGVVWSHKIQEKQADIESKKYKCLETIRIVASSVTSIGILSLIIWDEFWLTLFSMIVSFITVMISTLFQSFNMQESCAIHKKAAYTLLVVRDRYQHLLMEIRIAERSYEELNGEYIELEKEKHRVYSDSPSTSDKAVKLASQALKIRGDNKYTDDEINNFLPRILWKGES